MRLLRRLFVCLAALSATAGCAKEQLEYTEVKRIDEKVTEPELQVFLRIVRALPGERLPEMPPVFAPPPDWNSSRTLPVNELVAAEANRLAMRRNSVQWISQHLQRNRPLQRALRREQMTADQFVGLSLALGVAMARNTLREDRDLDEIIRQGREAVDRLRALTAPFNSLSPDAMHHIREEAVWLTRIDRARRLRAVPPENAYLIAQHGEELQDVFPEEFTTNPLDAVADLLSEKGLPFHETEKSGFDDAIEWSRDDAIFGTAPPEANI